MTDPSVIEDALAILRHGPASVLTTKQERNKIASLIERLASQAADPEWVAMRRLLQQARHCLSVEVLPQLTGEIDAALARSAREE